MMNRSILKFINYFIFRSADINRQKKYVGNHCCPNCGSENTQMNVSIQTNGFVATGFAGCSDCESTWNDRYSLIGFDNLKVPHQNIKASTFDRGYSTIEKSLPWKWDGNSVKDIKDRFDILNIYNPDMFKEFELTVPSDYRKKESYSEWQNPVNINERIIWNIQIIAVDKFDNALVHESRIDSCLDEKSDEFKIMSLRDALNMIDELVALADDQPFFLV